MLSAKKRAKDLPLWFWKKQKEGYSGPIPQDLKLTLEYTAVIMFGLFEPVRQTGSHVLLLIEAEDKPVKPLLVFNGQCR
ncbi:hypothetical protein [Endozoicomonas sp. SCSIO W0465]|uniref:hypothetical protein n=1 Tax=Endozoicomonas sp. SCSIO W0465 TaxID=2918516 RepID=UPI002074ACD6|nr:hypothetical protein [Endozoicomonas sp. SCSIO W0465]USE35943.1 hypothetical protein MJO57_28430 [Endozoicomonas sp. SCSIO W0465]